MFQVKKVYSSLKVCSNDCMDYKKKFKKSCLTIAFQSLYWNPFIKTYKVLPNTVGCHYNAVQCSIDISYRTAMSHAFHKSKSELTKDTPYLALTGEL